MVRTRTGRIRPGLAALALLAAAAAAQEDEPAEPGGTTPGELEEMVVTATRTERTLLDVPGSVTVIGLDEIAEIGGADIADVVADAEGVDVLRYGGPGSSSSAHLRGTYGVHTLVLVDGRTLNAPSLGGADLSALSPAFVERIEIVRGPASALYGTGAVGGVIQVFTREVPAEPVSEAHVSFGSFGTASASFLDGFAFGSGGALLGLHALRTDGHRPNSFFEAQELFGKFAFGDEAAGRTVVTLGVRDSRLGMPGPRPAEAVTPPFGNDEVTSLVDFTDSFSGYVQAEYKRGGFRARVSGDRREEKVHSEYVYYGDTFSDDSFNNTTKPEIETSMSLELGPGLKCHAGASYAMDRFDTRTDSENVTLGTTTTSEHEAQRDTAAVWGQVELEREGWQGVLGARWDEPDDYDGKASVRATTAWKAPEGLRVEAGVGTAFRAPTLNDLHWPNAGNPSLIPEESVEAEIGLKWTPPGKKGTRVSVAAFSKGVDNLIRWAPDVSGTWTPENVDEVRFLGMELAAKADLGAGFKAKLGYTLIDGKETGPKPTHVEDAFGASPLYTIAELTLDLAYVPKNQLTLGVEWSKQLAAGTVKAGLSLDWASEVVRHYEDWIWVGPDADDFDVNQIEKTLDAFWLVGLRVGWSWTKGEVFIKADNLLDEEYARQFGGLTDRGYPMPGRSVTAGVRVRF